MRKLLLISLFFVLLNISLDAQSVYEVQRRQDSLGLYSWKYGLFVDGGINLHSSTKFFGSPVLGLQNEIGSFSGFGINVGGFLEYPFSKNLSLMTRLGYYSLSGSFLKTETAVEPVLSELEDKLVWPKLEFTFDASLSTISIEPLFSYQITKGINLLAGFNAGYLMTSYSQNEVVTNGEEGIPKFQETGTWERNTVSDTTFPNASSLQIGLVIGASYDLAISQRILLSPEVYFQYGALGIWNNGDSSWSANSIRFGVSAKYIGDRPCPPGMTRNAQGNCEELPCAPGQIRNEDGECECRKGMFVNKKGDCEWPPCPERNLRRNEIGECIQFLYAEVKAEPILTSGLPAENTDVELKEAESITEQAILNYVFFDEKNASIPSRYVKYTNDNQVVNYSEEKIGDANNILNTYYNVLNILGYRLSVNPFANVILQSYNMGGSESNKPELPDMRIDSVATYLKDVWKIPEFRIKKQVYNLAPEVARSGDKLLLDEYRRVEFVIDTANLKILQPVKIKNLVLRLNRPRIDFLFDAMPLTKIESWELKVSQEDKILYEVADVVPKDKDRMPEFTSWFAGATANQINPDIKTLNYILNITDRNGETVKSEKTLQFNYIKFDPERKPEDIDSTFRMYYYVFNDNDVNRDITKISKYLLDVEYDPFNSKISITGYTDKKGDLNTNRLLSDARAREVANFLKDKKKLNLARTSATGRGFVELFDNSLPEGRLYNRLVIVEISTPMKEKEKVEDLVEGCFVLIYSDENELKSKSVLDYLTQRGAKDVFIEKYYMSALDKNYYRVRSKSYDDVREAVTIRAKLSIYLRQLNLDKPPTIECSKKDEK
ncbi:MAG: OmpA family protein [bacterium]